MSEEGTNLDFQGIRENANADFAFGFEELTALAPTQATTKSAELPFPCSKIFIYSDYELYWTWGLVVATTTDSIDTSNSLKLPANTLIQMNVPWGKLLESYPDGGRQPGKSLFFQCRTVSNNTASVRVVRG